MAGVFRVGGDAAARVVRGSRAGVPGLPAAPGGPETLELGRASAAVVESLAGVGEDEWLERYPFAVANVTQGGVTETLSCPACRSELQAHIAEGPPDT